jgi:predicted molibdopterin-dependent oxidoreductase YjgC
MADNEVLITLTIDGQEVTVPPGTTILEAARALDIDIPVICYHEATTSNGLCRICVVDVVDTRSERVERSRRTILEMLDSAVDLEQAPEIQAMMDDYGADRARFPAAQRREYPVLDDNPFYIRDYSQCVLCWRCVQVCAEDAQYTFALTFGERGFHTRISTAFGVSMPESSCVFCGQCVGVCPTGALKPKIEFGLEQGWSLDEIRMSTRRGKRRRQD